MTFLNETWFWTGAFAAIGSLGAVLIKEVLSSKTQIGIERLRLHERECLDAYKKLYGFVSSLGNTLFPPDDPQGDFIVAMKHSYKKEVEPNMLLFTEEIRKMLRELQSQYACLGNPDLVPQMKFEDFIRKRAASLLEELTKAVENQTDIILHKRP